MHNCDTPKMVIFILGCALMVMVIGGGIMNYQGREVDPRYFEVITIIVMGLVALLKTGNTSGDVQSVVVENKGKDEAIPTEPQ